MKKRVKREMSKVVEADFSIHTEMNRIQRRIAEVFGLRIPQP